MELLIPVLFALVAYYFIREDHAIDRTSVIYRDEEKLLSVIKDIKPLKWEVCIDNVGLCGIWPEELDGYSKNYRPSKKDIQSYDSQVIEIAKDVADKHLAEPENSVSCSDCKYCGGNNPKNYCKHPDNAFENMPDDYVNLNNAQYLYSMDGMRNGRIKNRIGPSPPFRFKVGGECGKDGKLFEQKKRIKQ